MANAVVMQFRCTSGKTEVGKCHCYFTSFFWGDDVDVSIDGVAYELNVAAPINYSLADLKGSMVEAVQNKATELGLTVSLGNIVLPTYEVG